MHKYAFFYGLLILFASCTEATDSKNDQFFVKDSENFDMDLKAQLADSLLKDPKNIGLWIQKGNLCKTDLDFKCALDAGAQAIMLDSTNLEARKLYAWTLINKQDPSVSDIETAKRHFQYVLTFEPKDPETLVSLANTFSLTGDFKTAMKFVNDALKIDEYYRDGYVLKGSIYKTLDKNDLALSSYQTALQIDPDFFMGQLHTAWLLTEMENHKLALEYYRNANALKPQNINALYGIGKSLQDLEQYDAALLEYKEIIEIEPAFYYAYFNQGFIKQYYQADLDSAIYFYEKVFDYKPEYVPAWYQMGNAYYDAKDYSNAGKAYAEALKIDENYTPAREAADRLRSIRLK